MHDTVGKKGGPTQSTSVAVAELVSVPFATIVVGSSESAMTEHLLVPKLGVQVIVVAAAFRFLVPRTVEGTVDEVVFVRGVVVVLCGGRAVVLPGAVVEVVGVVVDVVVDDPVLPSVVGGVVVVDDGVVVVVAP